jgi:AbrB family looped-hinge helix DNA binding protein
MKPTKITAKGQITLPIEVRESLGLQPGDKVEIAESIHGYIIKKHAVPSPFTKYMGCMKNKQKQTDQVIEELRGK